MNDETIEMIDAMFCFIIESSDTLGDFMDYANKCIDEVIDAQRDFNYTYDIK